MHLCKFYCFFPVLTTNLATVHGISRVSVQFLGIIAQTGGVRRHAAVEASSEL